MQNKNVKKLEQCRYNKKCAALGASIPIGKYRRAFEFSGYVNRARKVAHNSARGPIWQPTKICKK